MTISSLIFVGSAMQLKVMTALRAEGMTRLRLKDMTALRAQVMTGLRPEGYDEDCRPTIRCLLFNAKSGHYPLTTPARSAVITLS